MEEEEEGGLTRKNGKGGITRREKEEMEGNELTDRHTPGACRETVGGCCLSALHVQGGGVQLSAGLCLPPCYK